MTLLRMLLCTVVVGALFRLAWPADAAPTTTSGTLVPAINRLRATTGAAPLTVSWPLESAAMQRAKALVAGQDFVHGNFWTVLYAAGVPPGGDVAEVIAANADGPLNGSAGRLGAVRQWEASPPHHTIIHSATYRHVGTAELAWHGWAKGTWYPTSAHMVLYVCDLAS